MSERKERRGDEKPERIVSVDYYSTSVRLERVCVCVSPAYSTYHQEAVKSITTSLVLDNSKTALYSSIDFRKRTMVVLEGSRVCVCVCYGKVVTSFRGC